MEYTAIMVCVLLFFLENMIHYVCNITFISMT